MTTKIEKCRRSVNDSFASKLADAVAKKFDGLRVETNWNIMGMVSMTTRCDEKDFTPEQHAFIGAFSEGYASAKSQIREQP